MEAKKQGLEAEGKLPKAVIACIGGGSNAIGMFADFIDEKDVELIGVEAAGKGIDTNMHAASMAKGEVAIVHGMKTKCIVDEKEKLRKFIQFQQDLIIQEQDQSMLIFVKLREQNMSHVLMKKP